MRAAKEEEQSKTEANSQVSMLCPVTLLVCILDSAAGKNESGGMLRAVGQPL